MNDKERDNIAIANALYNKSVMLDDREEKIRYKEKEIAAQTKIIDKFIEKYSTNDCTCDSSCRYHKAKKFIKYRVINAMKYG